MNKGFFAIVLFVFLSFNSFGQEDSVIVRKSVVTDVRERLLGQSGVEVISSTGAPGMIPTVYVRGIGATPDVQPLYIVDGVRMTDVSMLSPSDICDMTVLKDAAALSKYGSAASGGAVIITTGRGNHSGLHAGYGVTAAMQQLFAAPEPFLLKDWRKNGFYQEEFFRDDAARTQKVENSFLHLHHAFLQYGSSKVNAYLGGSFMDNDGPLPDKSDRMKRANLAWSFDWTPVPWMRIETTGSFAKGSVTFPAEDALRTYLVSMPLASDRNILPHEDSSDRRLLDGRVGITLSPTNGLSLGGGVGYLGNLSDRLMRQAYDYLWDYSNMKSFQSDLFVRYGFSKGSHTLKTEASWNRIRLNPDRRWMLGFTTATYSDIRKEYFQPKYDEYVSWAEEARKQIESGEYTGNTPSFDGMRKILFDSAPISVNDFSASVDYSFKDRYHIGLYASGSTWKNDEDNDLKSFMVTSDFFLNWSASLRWDIGRESWFRDSFPEWWKALSLNFTGGHGETVAPVYADPSLLYYQSGFMYGSFSTRYGLIPTKAWMWEAGVSTRFSLAGDLSLSAVYFSRNENVLGYAPSSGHWYVLSALPVNGSTNIPDFTFIRSGLETSLSWRGSSGNFRYGADAALTLYRNRTENVPQERWSFLYPVGYRRQILDGKSIGAALVPEEGTMSGDRSFRGEIFPRTTYSFAVMAGWKNLSVTLSGHGMTGGMTILAGQYSPNPLTRHLVESGQMKSTDPYSSDLSMFGSSFFRLDNLRLDYGLPVGKAGTELGLFAAAENFLLKTSYKGTDPELSLSRKGLGYDSALFPSTRRFVFGLNIGF
ncbi:MAG: TonB-dependent receptor plug domain-containing protein [Bacteroidales bacterium]|nr:TonB-dependent receptor plug domain-containing protein [Bacteroidales bacterium]